MFAFYWICALNRLNTLCLLPFHNTMRKKRWKELKVTGKGNFGERLTLDNSKERERSLFLKSQLLMGFWRPVCSALNRRGRKRWKRRRRKRRSRERLVLATAGWLSQDAEEDEKDEGMKDRCERRRESRIISLTHTDTLLIC